MKTVEIFEEENSIVIDDQYTTDTLEFFPAKKIFEISSSVNDDFFYNYLTYEYKISTNPLELQYRLLERSHEPPKEYSKYRGLPSVFMGVGAPGEWSLRNGGWPHFSVSKS